jgi:hypothetical protein
MRSTDDLPGGPTMRSRDRLSGGPMRRHDLEPVSLIFGFAFTGLGLLFLIGQADQALRLRWIWPVLLLALGAGILLDVTRNRTRGGPDAEVTPNTDLTLGPTPDLTSTPDPDLVPEPDPDLTPEPEPDPTPEPAPGPEAGPEEAEGAGRAEGAVDRRERPI